MTNTDKTYDVFNGGRVPTYDEIIQIEREAHRLQGQIVAHHLKGFGRSLGRALVGVLKAPLWFFDAIGRARVGLRVHDELHGLTDRQLADIGIERHEINQYVMAAMDAAGTPAAAKAEENGLYSIPGGGKKQPRIETPQKRAA